MQKILLNHLENLYICKAIEQNTFLFKPQKVHKGQNSS